MSKFFLKLCNSLTQFFPRTAEVRHFLTKDLLFTGQLVYFHYQIILDHVQSIPVNTKSVNTKHLNTLQI